MHTFACSIQHKVHICDWRFWVSLLHCLKMLSCVVSRRAEAKTVAPSQLRNSVRPQVALNSDRNEQRQIVYTSMPFLESKIIWNFAPYDILSLGLFHWSRMEMDPCPTESPSECSWVNTASETSPDQSCSSLMIFVRVSPCLAHIHSWKTLSA